MYRHWAAYYLKSSLDRFPLLYLAGLRFKHRGRSFLRRIVSPTSDICIEGHNRSANSFAVKAFRSANDTIEYQHKIATHVHASSQVRRAVDFGVPTMVLIREPEATVISQKALAIQLKQVVDPEAFPMQIFLAMYADFYQRLLPYGEECLDASFEEVTNDFGSVMKRFNSKFKTNFEEIDHTPARERAIFQESRVHLSPSPERDQIKQNLIAEAAELRETKWMEEALSAYRAFIKLVESPKDLETVID